MTPRILDRQAYAALFSNESAKTLPIVASLLDMYGAEVTDWSPDTIYREIHIDTGVNPSTLIRDKIMAGLVLLTTDHFRRQIEAFVPISLVLNDWPADFSELGLLRPEHAAWAVTEAMMIHMDSEEVPKYSTEVGAYLGLVLEDAGLEPRAWFQGARVAPKPSAWIEMDAVAATVHAQDVELRWQQIDSYVRARMKHALDQLMALPMSRAEPGWIDRINVIAAGITQQPAEAVIR